MKKIRQLLPAIALLFILGGSTDRGPIPRVADPLPLLAEPLAEDEIFNDGSSSPTVSFSVIHGGLSSGTIDGGGNVDSEAELLDIFGSDAAIGTLDDDLNPTSTSMVVDAGSNAALPLDRFDLDGDGNTTESIPVDRSGNRRNFDGGTGSATTDIGAYEYGSPVATDIQNNIELAFQTFLDEPFPNPAIDGFSVRFGVQSPSVVRIVLYDALGREVVRVYEDQVQSGHEHEIQIATHSLASGVYFVRLMTETTELARRFVLAR